MLIFGAIWWLFGSKSKSAKALARAPKHQLLLSQFENIRYIRAPKVLSRKKKLLKNIFRKLRMSTPPSYGRVAEPNRTNFGENFTAFDPPSFSENHNAIFSENVRKKLFIKVQNLQYKFLEWKWQCSLFRSKPVSTSWCFGARAGALWNSEQYKTKWKRLLEHCLW